LLFDIDSEAIIAAALGAWTDTFRAGTPELNAPALGDTFDRYGASALHPIVVFMAAHDPVISFSWQVDRTADRRKALHH
jgi:hypothetical protein